MPFTTPDKLAIDFFNAYVYRTLDAFMKKLKTVYETNKDELGTIFSEFKKPIFEEMIKTLTKSGFLAPEQTPFAATSEESKSTAEIGEIRMNRFFAMEKILELGQESTPPQSITSPPLPFFQGQQSTQAAAIKHPSGYYAPPPSPSPQ